MSDNHCDDGQHFPRVPVTKIKIPLPAGVEDTPEIRERLARDLAAMSSHNPADTDIIAHARDALRPIARLCDIMERRGEWHIKKTDGITIDIFKNARAAYEATMFAEVETVRPSSWRSAASIDEAKDGRQVIVRYIGRDGVSSRFACVRWIPILGQWTLGRTVQDIHYTLKNDPIEWCEIPTGHGST